MNNDSLSAEGDSKPSSAIYTNGQGNGKSRITHWLKTLFGRRGPEQSLKSELEEIIQEHEEEGNVVPEENEIIRNVLKFNEARVTDVMTPRSDISAASSDITLDDLRKIIIEYEHTRIPIFRENLDDIIGFIHIKDLIPFWGDGADFNIHSIVRELLFVPPSMRLHNLLVKMRAERTHMAIVVDEYGGTDGLVTIEDLVEEIVGEIEDEHDEENTQELIKLAEGVYDLSARFEIGKLEEELGQKIYSDDEMEEFDTIGGLIFTQLGRVPKLGETLRHRSGITLKVTDGDKRRIKRVKVIVSPK